MGEKSLGAVYNLQVHRLQVPCEKKFACTIVKISTINYQQKAC